jgi:hypothetical protein
VALSGEAVACNCTLPPTFNFTAVLSRVTPVTATVVGTDIIEAALLLIDADTVLLLLFAFNLLIFPATL